MLAAGGWQPEPLAVIADFMTAMLTYFQTGYELLAEIVPEIDAMKVSDTLGVIAWRQWRLTTL